MNTATYFQLLTEEIHSVVVATTDENGLPSTRVIDMMLYDDNGLYFLTAKGKSFYRQLMNKSYISLSGLTGGEGSMAKKAISVSGAIRNIGTEKLDVIFNKNPYMDEIYPTPESRTALEVFCLYKGQGEFFDLTTKPISRASFSFGGQALQQFGYFITSACTACGRCLEKCPQQCIDKGSPYVIIQQQCLHCGNCMEVCPVDAVVRR